MAALPELAGVGWRQPVDERWLRRREREWGVQAGLYPLPFVSVGLLLLYLEPLTFPFALAAFAHAWAIPELFAWRGARVLEPKGGGAGASERAAQVLLGDLLAHEPRALQRETGLALERGALGVWLVGEQGVLLVRPGGRRVHCFCVRVAEGGLPPSDRIAHLLLALRADEKGFATVANQAFAGAGWRVRRRLARGQRPALAAAVTAARTGA